jgi:transcriptional regulator with XRE-family HTH domain
MMKIYDYGGKKNICGNRIKKCRNGKRLSQLELAARMQVEGVILERDSISRVEIGTRFVADYELKVFAKVLVVSVDWLLEQEIPC